MLRKMEIKMEIIEKGKWMSTYKEWKDVWKRQMLDTTSREYQHIKLMPTDVTVILLLKMGKWTCTIWKMIKEKERVKERKENRYKEREKEWKE